jgi:nanoRNase/pAp phosphatase (c-di-AMP/oligoRNAs hydrolase)
MVGEFIMKKLDQIIACIKNRHVYIQTHNFPDPDAVASAYGLQFLLKQKEIASTICYKGKIEQSSSARMAKLLDINIVELDEMDKMPADAEIILVDSQKDNANTINLPGSKIICIDHHPTFEKANYECSDIRPEVGACASIIAKYFFENAINMNQQVATALIYGIKIDTANLTRGVSDLDLEMFYRMYKMADKKQISSLDTSVLCYEDLKMYAHAINSVKIQDRICFAHTGAECQESIVASISDFLLALNEVDVAIVYSMREDGIKLSIRSKSNYNVGLIANKVLQGIGNGGGHEHMAGGFVPFDMETVEEGTEGAILLDAMFVEIEKRFISNIKTQE